MRYVVMIQTVRILLFPGTGPCRTVPGIRIL